MSELQPFPPEDHEQLRAELARARATEERYERWFKRLDEQVRVLDRERQKFAAMVSQTDSCVFVTDPTGTIHWANPVLAALPPPGDPHQGWIGRRCRDVCSSWDGGCDADSCGGCPVARALERGETVHQELHARKGEGTRTLYLTALPIRGPDGRPHEVMIMAQDLSDLDVLRRSETRYRQTEERLRTVVASAPVVLFALDRDGIFTLSEGRGLDVLGLESGEVVGRSVYEQYRDVPEIHEHVRRALAGEEFTSTVDLGGLAFETHYVPLRDNDGGVVGLIGVATDVTDHRRLEDQLRQSQKMEAVGRLAGGVAHDFNNLLTAILGSCELLLMRLAPEDPLRRYAEEIQKGGVRGSLLTRQLLAFGRRELLAPRILDVRGIVSEMDYMLKRLVGEDVDYVTRFGPRAASVWADQGHMEQVLMNLVVNARDAMPEGGRLTVEVSNVVLDAAYCQSHAGSNPGSYVLLAVSDTGCGMSPDVQARVFEPFFTTKERGRGTGLGLSTVYGIVSQWCGHIGLYSEARRGTSFKVYLPLAAESVGPDEAAPPVLSAGAMHGSETILLVEDEETVRAIAREILELHGYAVIEARDGVEALVVAEAHPDPIHLVLTDVVMPRMSGGHLVERLLPLRPETKVLFMSGYPDDAVVRNGLLDARAEFVQKPFSLEGLVHRVREVLDQPSEGESLPVPSSRARRGRFGVRSAPAA
jgi:two-component system cell cycle sensor histidine kinase/response regulator CckA